MNILTCPNCNERACSLVEKIICVRIILITCKSCGVRLYPVSYFRPIVNFFLLFSVPLIVIWSAGKWDSWIPGILYAFLVVSIHYVWKVLSPLKII